MQMFPTETARPIMGYVRELEGKVLALRAELKQLAARERRVQGKAFLSGLATGAVAIYLILRYVH